MTMEPENFKQQSQQKVLQTPICEK